MYHVFTYRDKNDESPIEDYIMALTNKSDKSSRIMANKILKHIAYLEKYGHHAREPYVKNLGGEIWELRPQPDRILFAAWEGNGFILLHHFMKTTQKIPQREIEQAKRNLADYRERMKNDGQ